MSEAIEALRAIARSVDVGHSGRVRRVPRCELIAKARDACDAIGVDYSVGAINPTRLDAPDSAPKHENYWKKRS